MPKLMVVDDKNMVNFNAGGGYNFSAIRPDDLGATEYTLVTIVVDISGSVYDYANELLNCLKAIIEACKKSPRAENLLVRIITFNYRSNIQEIHGFKLLSMIDPNEYKPFNPDGSTALIDASYDSITATLTYSKNLIDQDFNANGAIYIITDGENNDSFHTEGQLKKLLETAKKQEVIESLITVLIGINIQDCKDILEDFQKKSGITQFVDAGNATPQRLAYLAAFVSKSISSQSQAVGSGAPSQPVTF